MKENVLDILTFLFENYLDAQQDPPPSREVLKSELQRAGFTSGTIDRALGWLDGLVEGMSGIAVAPARAMRVFTAREQQRLDTECRGYLQHLENIGILSAVQREIAIERLMALEAEEIALEQLKWVVLMVLFSQPGQEQAYARLEHLVFEQRAAVH